VNYAAAHPDRVSHLILSDGWAQYSDFPQTAVVQMEKALREMDWVLFTDTFGRVLAGFDNVEDGIAYAEYFRACTTQEGYKAASAGMEQWDVRSDLARITSPTLVLHSTRNNWLPVASGQRLAAAIPGAVFRLLEAFPKYDDAVPLVAEFCGVSPRPKAAVAPTGALVTILFTDVEGSTLFTDRLGDAAAREVMREHERITREALKAHGGSEVKTMGDGFMASFGSATKALECAVAIQKAFADPNRGVGVEQLPNDVSNSDEGVAVAQPLRAPASSKPSAEDAIRVRIGLNAGEPIAEDDPDGRGDLFGTAVSVAARIAAQAHGGEILVSDVVRQLVAGKGFLFNDRGEQALKGFEDPVRVWEVQWSE
jgi:class 3 adenylate cyclase